MKNKQILILFLIFSIITPSDKEFKDPETIFKEFNKKYESVIKKNTLPEKYKAKAELLPYIHCQNFYGNPEYGYPLYCKDTIDRDYENNTPSSIQRLINYKKLQENFKWIIFEKQYFTNHSEIPYIVSPAFSFAEKKDHIIDCHHIEEFIHLIRNFGFSDFSYINNNFDIISDNNQCKIVIYDIANNSFNGFTSAREHYSIIKLYNILNTKYQLSSTAKDFLTKEYDKSKKALNTMFLKNLIGFDFETNCEGAFRKLDASQQKEIDKIFLSLKNNIISYENLPNIRNYKLPNEIEEKELQGIGESYQQVRHVFLNSPKLKQQAFNIVQLNWFEKYESCVNDILNSEDRAIINEEECDSSRYTDGEIIINDELLLGYTIYKNNDKPYCTLRFDKNYNINDIDKTMHDLICARISLKKKYPSIEAFFFNDMKIVPYASWKKVIDLYQTQNYKFEIKISDNTIATSVKEDQKLLKEFYFNFYQTPEEYRVYLTTKENELHLSDYKLLQLALLEMKKKYAKDANIVYIIDSYYNYTNPYSNDKKIEMTIPNIPCYYYDDDYWAWL